MEEPVWEAVVAKGEGEEGEAAEAEGEEEGAARVGGVANHGKSSLLIFIHPS